MSFNGNHVQTVFFRKLNVYSPKLYLDGSILVVAKK